MALAGYSLNCADDLGDRLGYIVTLILTFVAFSDTLNNLIPDVPYLTFLVCHFVCVCVFFVCIDGQHLLKFFKSRIYTLVGMVCIGMLFIYDSDINTDSLSCMGKYV